MYSPRITKVYLAFEVQESLCVSGSRRLLPSAKTCHDAVMGIIKRLQDVYRFPGFVPLAQVRGVFGDPYAVVITLRRRRKKRAAVFVDAPIALSTISVPAVCAICPVATSGLTWSCRFAGSGVASAAL